MDSAGSEAGPAIPAWSAILAWLVGAAGMLAAARALVTLVPFRLAIVLASMTLALPGVLTVALLGIPLGPGLGLVRVSRRTVLLAMAAGLAFWIGSLGLLELQYAVWAPPAGYLEGFQRLHDALRPANAIDAVWSVVAIAAAPAFFEEILTRGVLLPALRPSLGAWGAVFGSAAAFALMHFDLYRLVFTFAVGLCLGALRVRTGTLWPSMLTHATLNTLTFVAAPWLDDPAEPLPDPRPWLGAGLLLLGSVGAWLVFRALRRPLTGRGA